MCFQGFFPFLSFPSDRDSSTKSSVNKIGKTVSRSGSRALNDRTLTNLVRNYPYNTSKTVSSAYLRLLIFTPPIFAPFISSTFLNIFSVYRLNKFGDVRCHSTFCSYRRCSQYSLLIICKS